MHFTYKSAAQGADLEQGDILKRTPAVEAILGEVHPHYLQADYHFFQVLTQSCDLVRRNNCKARYISLAAVRPLERVLERRLASLQRFDFERTIRFATESVKAKMEALMERLLNNNEEEFFFLRREPSVAFESDHCTFLQLSIAVKAELHYQALCEARILQLEDTFQHKLGYLVGKLYSRIATDDWLPDHCLPQEFKELITKPIEDLAVVWLDGKVHAKVVAQLQAMQSPGPADFENVVKLVKEASSPAAKKKRAVAAVEEVLSNPEINIAPDLISTISKRLTNSPALSLLLKE